MKYSFWLTASLFLATAGFVTSAHAAGDAAAGAKRFKQKCAACHVTSAKPNKIGPALGGIFGRKAGTAVGFKRYKGLKGADWVWNEAELDAYLKDPKKYTKGKTGKKANMAVKLKKKADRDNIIAFLKAAK